ncbi:hypothetical protein ACIQ2D_09170 [Lysinibacillus sp. NPDC097287]|uniref:hypothetical protein n=1 Tax=Lysinibacillus sp. NPDC097287 TaxID=3364144 RepID=UPI00382313B5
MQHFSVVFTERTFNKWFDTASIMKETIVYNAMMAAIFVPNENVYAFNIDVV